ncbi:MAG: hypothetical protein ABIQ35_12890 [Verrucomicrobiota bacterium]
MNSDALADRKPGVLICFAVKEEAAPFLKTAAASRAQVLVTGMGARNAGRAIENFLENSKPEMVLSCGFAGGLDPALEVGAVIFSPDADFSFLSRLISSRATPATFFCAKRVATTREEKSALRVQSGCDAVDMESELIRRICKERGIPSATVRVISDAANEDLPLDFNRLMTEEYELDFAKLLRTVALNPWKIPALIRLQRKTRLAAENLRDVLETLPI